MHFMCCLFALPVLGWALIALAGPTYYPSLSPHSISIITTIAGTGSAGYSGDGGEATSADIQSPHGIAIDSSGNVYFSEWSTNHVRKITVSTGIITTYAGIGASSYSGDGGVASSAAINGPEGLCIDAAGNVYIAETGNSTVRKVLATSSIISTVAGTGSGGYSGDNASATSATLRYPSAIAIDTAGNLYISDNGNCRIRKIAANGIITTLAGTGTYGYKGDEGQAANAELGDAHGINLDTVNNIYFCTYLWNSTSHVVRKITVSTGIISTVAGSGNSKYGYNGDNIPATTAMLSYPWDVVVDSYGNLYVADRHNNRIRKVDVSTGLISTMVGTGIASSTGDRGAATSATVNQPCFSRFDSAGNYYISECEGNKLRKVITVTTETPTVAPSMAPSRAPTSAPTANPTKTDIIDANFFEITIDGEVAKVKVKYYLGTFVGYFLSIYICLYLYSFLRYGKGTVTKLYDISYQSQAYIRNSAASEALMGDFSLLSDLYAKNLLVRSNMRLEEELKAIKEASSGKHKKSSKEEIKYSKGYREYMQQQRTLLGCSPFLYPDGYVVKIPLTSIEIHLPPGRVEDIILFLCHNHPLFSCFYFMDGSKLGAHGTRILYIGKDVSVFVLYQFSNMLLQHFDLVGHGLGTIINLFLITPSAVSVGLLLKYLYTCPFTEAVDFQRRYSRYQSVVLLLGRLAILPIMFIMSSCLIIACLFSSGRHIPLILVRYFIYVQFYGILLAIVKALLLFVDSYYYQLTLFGVFDILHIGRMFKERIMVDQLALDVDYAYRINTYIFGVIRVQKILNRVDAIKAKWIVDAGEHDIEMKGGIDEAVVQNPLTKVSTHRNTVAFDVDAIYGVSNNEKGGYMIDHSYIESVENPIYQSVNNNRQELLRLHQSAINSASEDVSAADDDAALYLEYQNLQNQRDETIYDMAVGDDTIISFEEWKTMRKEFKQGTRGSFIKAFQVFEEREHLVAASSEQSASVKNTMQLHSIRAKNALARPK